MTEWQSDRHSMVLSIRVGEIFLCLISINSPTRFARRGITSQQVNWLLKESFQPWLHSSLKSNKHLKYQKNMLFYKCCARKCSYFPSTGHWIKYQYKASGFTGQAISKQLTLVSGLPQGGILSPIIFTVDGADLEDWLKHSKAIFSLFIIKVFWLKNWWNKAF